MARKKKSGTIGGIILTGVIIGLIVAFGKEPISDLFSMPEIIGIVKAGTTSVCPTSLDFSRGSGLFSFAFSNKGTDDGSFVATVSSQDVLSRYKGSGQQFTKMSSQDWFAEQGKDVTFNFEVQRIDDENPFGKITIKADLECFTDIVGVVPISCGERHISCSYELAEDRVRPTHYDLIP